MKKNVCSGYAIDFTNNTFTMNYTFAKASKIVGSAEYRTVKRALEDFPNLTVITKAGREITTPRKTNRLTYANIRTPKIRQIAVRSENADRYELLTAGNTNFSSLGGSYE